MKSSEISIKVSSDSDSITVVFESLDPVEFQLSSSDKELCEVVSETRWLVIAMDG
ncbi:hypothetical protein A2U01_0004598 [Trifolium medium]|uniref:Uncharacterized protein n=1 Tax=Trifolium medium TaxID=97028 RepID=A0A392M8G3_9FABA|nr:hypothetical protein [Trifolium medium]